jgi:hypothetical protein
VTVSQSDRTPSPARRLGTVCPFALGSTLASTSSAWPVESVKNSGVQTEGFIRLHGPWLPAILRIFREGWEPLQVHIDRSGAGLLRPREIRTFAVSPGTHEVQVRWARAHHLQSPIFTIEVQANETVDVVCAHPRLRPMGLSKLRLATAEEIGRAKPERAD